MDAAGIDIRGDTLRIACRHLDHRHLSREIDVEQPVTDEGGHDAVSLFPGLRQLHPRQPVEIIACTVGCLGDLRLPEIARESSLCKLKPLLREALQKELLAVYRRIAEDPRDCLLPLLLASLFSHLSYLPPKLNTTGMGAGTVTSVPPTRNLGHSFTDTEVLLGVMPRKALISLVTRCCE